MLDSVQEASNEAGEAGTDRLAKAGPLLFQARVKLDQLNNLLDKWDDSFSIGRLDRLFWMKERKKAWELQRQLREIRSSLSVVLEVSTLYVTRRFDTATLLLRAGLDYCAKTNAGNTVLHLAPM